MLGDQVVLRRIDRLREPDAHPYVLENTYANCEYHSLHKNVITDRCSTVNDIWVPLEAAQIYIEPIPSTSTSLGALHLFL